MALNGNILKYGIIAIVIGGIIATSAFIIAYNILNNQDTNHENGNGNGNGDGNGNGEIPEGGIGAQIAARMAASEDNISYVWCYNNTWVNFNLSMHYTPLYIDGIRVGLVNDIPKMALIHEPVAELADINQQDLNDVMANFRGAIEVLNDTSQTLTDIMDIFPPSFICDIAYEDGTSLSLIFSKEHSVLSVLNGTWELSQHTHFGINTVNVAYNFDDLVFLPLSDAQLFLTAIQSFEDLIYETFPV
ncbi:MAG: hypothetical protein JSW11_16790 [Candidatus Heimdallarchaeota archaeon]|nr:MAG: hypothetical protein JSW11_16790 [Candidatus Heimdallarchaeota archaeon]